MIIDPQDAVTVQVVTSVLSLVAVAAVSWGSQRAHMKMIEKDQEENGKEHHQIWGVIRNHEGRLGKLEGQVKGHRA